MGGECGREVFMAFLLVPNVDEAVVDTHFEFGWGVVAASLVFVELF